MKKYATAYVDMSENNAVANIIEATSIQDAMKQAILTNRPDEYTKEWIDGLDAQLTIEELRHEIMETEQSVDAVEIVDN